MKAGECKSCNESFKDGKEAVCICSECFTRLKALVLQQEEEEKAFKPSNNASSVVGVGGGGNNNHGLENCDSRKMVLFLEMPQICKKRRFLDQPMSLHKDWSFDQLCSKLIHRFASRNVRLPTYHSNEQSSSSSSFDSLLDDNNNNNNDVSFEINDSIHKDEYISFENLNDLFDGCRIKILLSEEYLAKRAQRDEKLRERRSRGNSNVSNFSSYSNISNTSSNPTNQNNQTTTTTTAITTTHDAGSVTAGVTPVESSSQTPTVTATIINDTNDIENDAKKDDFSTVIALTSKSNSLTDSPVMVSMPNNNDNNTNHSQNSGNRTNVRTKMSEIDTKEVKTNRPIINKEDREHPNMETTSPDVANFTLQNTNSNNSNNNITNNDNITINNNNNIGDNNTNNNHNTTRHVFDNSLDLKQRYKESIASFNLFSSPIVIDNGSGIIKGGFSHHVDSLHGPQYTMPNAYYDAPGPNRDGLIGQSAIDACVYSKGGFDFNIFENGTIKNFDKMSYIWNQLLNNILKKEYNKIISNKQNNNNNNNNIEDEFNLENHSILMTERYNSPMKQRETCAQILFEQYNVSGLFLANPACLAIYSSGKTKGVVLDIGHQTTTVASVYEGTTIPNSGTKVICNHSGFELTKSIMNKYYNNNNNNSNIHLNYKSATRVKEDLYQVPYDEIDIHNYLKQQTFKLPDGRKLDLGRDRYELALSHMFGNAQELSVSKLVSECILSNHIELQDILWKNIVLTGGTSLMNGLAERFAKEIRHLTKVKTQVIATKNRKNKVWIGGSVVASISTFNDLAISKEKYDEVGMSILRTMQL